MYYTKQTKQINYTAPLDFFKKFPQEMNCFLLESHDTAPIYSKNSLLSVDPPLEIIGKDEAFTIQALNQHGLELIKNIPAEKLSFCHELTRDDSSISGKVPREMKQLDESHRQQQHNISSVIRILLKIFKSDDPLLGLYGAFSYDFVRLFEDLPDTHEPNDIPDFHLYLPDIIYTFDHHKQSAELHYYNFSNTSLAERLEQIPQTGSHTDFKVGNLKSSMNQEQYETAVRKAKEFMAIGDIFEIVLSRSFQANFQGSALSLYEKYRKANPSPYMFYFRFNNNTPLGNAHTLFGTSPEMFVRVKNDTITVRPISGTARRSDDPIQDYQNMMDLLNSPKEKAELDMLIDLARNDVSRVSLPGITLEDYRYIEKYSKVMHTIAHVEGKLDTQNFTALDAFIAALNAGTLTGAPKIRAMELIEEMENSRRGYYGGNVGYITFNNELNTGIIIRSALVEHNAKHDTLTTQAGASLVYDSDPTSEYKETENKAAALMTLLKNNIQEDL